MSQGKSPGFDDVCVRLIWELFLGLFDVTSSTAPLRACFLGDKREIHCSSGPSKSSVSSLDSELTSLSFISCRILERILETWKVLFPSELTATRSRTSKETPLPGWPHQSRRLKRRQACGGEQRHHRPAEGIRPHRSRHPNQENDFSGIWGGPAEMDLLLPPPAELEPTTRSPTSLPWPKEPSSAQCEA